MLAINRLAIVVTTLGLLTTPVSSQSLSLEETSDVITIRQGDHVVLSYNKRSPKIPDGMDPVYRRSGCLHPVGTPSGRTVTAMFPFDHPHQHGVFAAWVKTRYRGKKIDFWNLAAETGRVLHDRVVSVFEDNDTAGFEVELLHRALLDSPVNVLRETWKVTAYQVDSGYHCFDLELSQRALTDDPLVVEKNRYGGLAVRGPTGWLTENDRAVAKRDADSDASVSIERSGFLNDMGSDRIEGNHQRPKWVALWGDVREAPATISVLSHPENFRAPQTTRLHPTKPYFCFSPCVEGTFEIDREHPYVAKYRFLVTDSMPDSQWLNQEWEKWQSK